MSMIKRGTCMSKVAVAETLYSCTSCGYKDVGGKCGSACPECGAAMEPLAKSKRRAVSKSKRD